MADNTSTMKRRKLFIVFFLFYEFISFCHVYATLSVSSEYVFTPKDIIQIVENSCFIGISNDVMPESKLMHSELKQAFSLENSVLIGLLDIDNFIWPSGKTLVHNIHVDKPDKEVIVFAKTKKDRTCLATGSFGTHEPVAERHNGAMNTDLIVEFINHKCETYRKSNGLLSLEGLHREEILVSLFHAENVSNTNMRQLSINRRPQHCTKNSCEGEISNKSETKLSGSDNKRKYLNEGNADQIKTCQKIPYPMESDFFHNYLKISKPVIFTGAIDHWPAMHKWTNKYLREHYGNHSVHIKLTPSGEFEGVDSANQFENYESFKIPDDVINQLQFPDLVVVRPATVNIKLSQFLDLFESVANTTRTGISAYLEYSSIANSVPELEEDIEEMVFFKHMLELKHKNIWLSDGNTLGKLHFDPFDNFLCQISGRKQVILFEPHNNSRLYEAHIPEAMLSYNQTTKKFSKKALADSTSMVMSPVDILYPDFERFPLLGDAYPLNCTIDEGEVLFMPAFWWHEVQSYPNVEQGRNLAVNFWYDPFLVKEFPCPECKLDVNPKYRHLL